MLNRIVTTSLALVTLTALAERPASAGASSTTVYACAQIPGTSNFSCRGSLRAVRRSPDSTDAAAFVSTTATPLTFTARFGNVLRSCSFSSSQLSNLKFSIDFNTVWTVIINSNGTCGTTQLEYVSTEQANDR